MIEVRKTAIFTKWFDSLKDRKAKVRIQARIDRVEMGNFGDVAPLERVLVNYAYSIDQDTEYISFSVILLL